MVVRNISLIYRGFHLNENGIQNCLETQFLEKTNFMTKWKNDNKKMDQIFGSAVSIIVHFLVCD